jgi:hypothetical protein
MQHIPRFLILLVVGLSALLAASATVLGLAAVAMAEKPAWALFGFELVILVAAAMGVLFGVGRFRDAPAMALVCIAGTIFAAAILGWASVAASVGEAKTLARIPLTPLMASRVLAAAALAAVAAYCVLSRTREAWRTALLGALLGSPAVAVGAALVNPSSRQSVAAVLTSPWGAVIAFIVLGALLAASIHLLIRGFEIGSMETKEPAAPPTSSSAGV